MSKFIASMIVGMVLMPSVYAADYSWADQRQAQCTQRANDRNMTNRQEFVDFCLYHSDAEVQRYWDCAPKADKRDLGVDTRRRFMDWCVKEGNYNKAELNSFANCNEQAAKENLEGSTRDAFVNKCVERAGH